MLPKSTLLLLLALLCIAVAIADSKPNVDVASIQLPKAASNGAFGSNSTLLEVHVRLFNDLLVKQALFNNATTAPALLRMPLRSHNFIQEFADILWNTANVTEWQRTLQLLTELAANTQNLDVKYLTYEVLWQKLQTTTLRYNPANVLELYAVLQNANFSNAVAVPVDFVALLASIRGYIIERSAQLLEAPLYAAHSYNNNTFTTSCTQFPVVEQLLAELARLPDDIYNDTLSALFDTVEQLESSDNITKALLCLGGSVPQRLLACVKYQSRLLKQTVAVETIDLLQHNIEQLVRHADLGQIPADLLAHINFFLPRSLRALRDSKTICIRNATNWSNYLYECAQTFLMCTHEGANQYRASYRVERLLGHKFIFRSNYWSARYIKLAETGNNVNGGAVARNATMPVLIKNVYSDLKASVWQAVFVGDLVAFLDVDMRFYLCGGNPSMWSSNEHHVYTRRAQDFQLYRQECLWLIEDCSDAV